MRIADHPHTGKVVAFDPITNTFSNVAIGNTIRDDSGVRSGQSRENIPREDLPKPPDHRD